MSMPISLILPQNKLQNYEEIEKLYDGIKKFTKENCLDCWAQRICHFCYQHVVDESGNIIMEMPCEFCEKSKKGALDDLSVFCKKAIYGTDDSDNK